MLKLVLVKMIFGFFLLSLRVIFLKLFVVVCMILCSDILLFVKEIKFIKLFFVIFCLMVVLGLSIMLMMFDGKLIFLKIFIIWIVVKGVILFGLIIIVFLVVSVGVNF